MDALEALGTARSMRWLQPDPVPAELIDKVLWGATRASSPANVQPWEFVVVRDEDTRRELSRVITEPLGGVHRQAAEAAGDPARHRMFEGVSNLVRHFGDVPVLVFVCGRNVYPPEAPEEAMMYSAVYGAAQNLLVAARAVGLGTVYTTFHRRSEATVKAILGIPDEVRICVTIPIGWPARPFGQMRRKPMERVVHHDHW
jgi:nitroreductase